MIFGQKFGCYYVTLDWKNLLNKLNLIVFLNHRKFYYLISFNLLP